MVGWLLRGRRSASELARLLSLHAESYSQADETSTDIEAKEFEQATQELEGNRTHVEKSTNSNPNPQERNQLPDTATSESAWQLEKQLLQAKETQTEINTKIVSLTSFVKRQQAFIQQQKEEELKLKKTVVSIHKKYLKCCAANKQLHSKVAIALEPAGNQSVKKTDDELATEIRKLHAQVQNCEQLENDYETVSQKYQASSTRINDLELSLKETVGLKEELALAKKEIDSLQMLEETAQQQKEELAELQKRNKQQEQQASQLEATVEDLEKDRQELKVISHKHQSLQQKLEESETSCNHAVEKLESTLLEHQQSMQTIDELKSSLVQAENDRKRIVELEKELQTTKVASQSSVAKINSLHTNIQEVTQDRDALLTEKSGWEIDTSKQDTTISRLKEKNQEYLSELSGLRSELVSRDERLVKVLDQTALQKKQAETDKKRINELEKDLQTAKTVGQGSVEKINSLLADVQEHMHNRDALLKEKADWETGTTKQKKMISALEEKNQKNTNELSTLRSELSTRDTRISKILDESLRREKLSEENKKRISELGKDLQTAKTARQSDAQIINSLQIDVQKLTHDRDALQTEKEDWVTGATSHKSTISRLEEKNRQYLSELSGFRNELVARDEKIAAIVDESVQLKNRATQLQNELDSQQVADKEGSDRQKEQIASLTDKLKTSTDEIEILGRNLKQLEAVRSEVELLRKEKSELTGKLENIAQQNGDLLATQELAAGKQKELASQFGLLETESLQLRGALESLQRENKTIPDLQFALSTSEKKLNAATFEINNLQAKLKENTHLEENVRTRESTISDMHRQQVHLQKHGQRLKRELDSARASLSRSKAALSERTADYQKLSATHAELKEKLKQASAEIAAQQSQLKNKVQLEQALSKQEREITDLRKKQTRVEEHRRDLDNIKDELAQSKIALSGCTAESQRMLAKLKIQQQIKDELKEQKDLVKDMQKRVVAFDTMKFELSASKEAHEQLRKTIPDIDELQKRLKKIERKNRQLSRECESIPKLQKQLAKARRDKKELNAIHKGMELELESLKKENTANKRRANRLYRQANPSSSTAVHKKLVRNEVKKTLSRKKSKIKKSSSNAKSVANKKKRPARKSITVNKSKRSKTIKSSRKRNRNAIPDDLKKIHGIGPVLEKLLHKKGITRFEQLAQLDHKAIEDLSASLGSYSYRIKKDAWVKNAAKLAKKPR